MVNFNSTLDSASFCIEILKWTFLLPSFGSKIAFFRFLCKKEKNRKTEVELLFSFFVQDQKKEKTERELFLPFCVHGEKKIDETEVNLLFASFVLNVKKSPKM